jgi:pyruvate dehydrogenase E2 component (dihydrolipoamide acetyltransferase)
VIYSPQVALVGLGKVTERPWAQHGMLGVRPIVAATLAADHRVSDGHRGGLFLAAIDRLLQQPEEL